MTERLTTLADVKGWLDINDSNGDTGLLRLINAASQFVLNYLNRDTLQVKEYTQNFRGNGSCSQLLKNWPVLSASSVGIKGQLIQASVLGVGGLPGSGYTISDPRNAQQSIDLYGHNFWYGTPCQIIYVAGFRAEQSTVIASTGAPPTITHFTPTEAGLWTANIRVMIDGIVATAVADVSPIPAGQYIVDEWGSYAFSLEDVGKTAEVVYDYCPFDLSQGVTELIGEWYRRKDRIGLLSKVLGGQETVTFSQKDMNDTVKSAFMPYKNVIPL